KKSKIKVETLIADVIEQTTSLFDQANVTLSKNVDNESKFVADPQRVAQVLVNLISNAIKFSAENGTVEVGCASEDTMVKLYVKDYGAGIPEKFKRHIFERFSQADSSDDRKIQRGTGLGLAISKRMTEDMGGIIGFESSEGQGSTFYVTFPQA
ncbi:MAG: HAMP domain-containing histidine kinase, partial [Gammaproteobacteria bacterium]|nr:HAMP domain-containing histidine kinase [Gammaproteobacteria bacterium]